MDLWNLPSVVYGFSLIKQQLFQKSAQKNVIDELIDKKKPNISFESLELHQQSNLRFGYVLYVKNSQEGIVNGWADCYRKAFFIEPLHEKSIPHS